MLLAGCAAPLHVPANSKIDDALAGCTQLLTREDAVRQLPPSTDWASTEDGGEVWTWILAIDGGRWEVSEAASAGAESVTVQFTFSADGLLQSFRIDGNRAHLANTPFAKLAPEASNSLGTRLSATAQGAPRADFSGRWLLHEGQQVGVIISQLGDRVTLTHEDGEWAMQGTVRGRTISGYWYRVKTDDPTRRAQNSRWGYRAEFEMAPAGDLMWYRVSSGDHRNWNRTTFAVRAAGKTGNAPLAGALEPTHWDFNGIAGGFVSRQPGVLVESSGDRLEVTRTRASDDASAPLTTELLPFLDLPAEEVRSIVIRARAYEGDRLECLCAWNTGSEWTTVSRPLRAGDWYEYTFPLDYAGRGDGHLRAIAVRLAGPRTNAAGTKLEIDRVDIDRVRITE